MENSINNLSVPEMHKQNTILWTAFLVGGTLMGTIIFFLTYTHPEFYNFDNFLQSPMLIIATAITFLNAFMGERVLKKRYEEAKDLKGLKEKFISSRANFILKAALHEGPLVICIVFMQIENNVYFLILAAINWILLYLSKPTIEKFKENYDLSSSEKQELTMAGLV